MASFESSREQAKKIDEEAEKIKHLIESDKACDFEDAKDALFEEAEAKFFRELDEEEYIGKINKRLKELDSESEKLDKNSKESLEYDYERYNLRFEKAVILGSVNADEREFLYYKYWLDLPVTESEDSAINKKRESSRRRLKEKADALSLKIGIKHSEQAFEKYRAKLQELFKSY